MLGALYLNLTSVHFPELSSGASAGSPAMSNFRGNIGSHQLRNGGMAFRTQGQCDSAVILESNLIADFYLHHIVVRFTTSFCIKN